MGFITAQSRGLDHSTGGRDVRRKKFHGTVDEMQKDRRVFIDGLPKKEKAKKMKQTETQKAA